MSIKIPKDCSLMSELNEPEPEPELESEIVQEIKQIEIPYVPPSASSDLIAAMFMFVIIFVFSFFLLIVRPDGTSVLSHAAIGSVSLGFLAMLCYRLLTYSFSKK